MAVSKPINPPGFLIMNFSVSQRTGCQATTEKNKPIKEKGSHRKPYSLAKTLVQYRFHIRKMNMIPVIAVVQNTTYPDCHRRWICL